VKLARLAVISAFIDHRESNYIDHEQRDQVVLRPAG
jgi:hypothetical protein